MNIIEVNGITKDYGNGKGVFDLSFSIPKGEVFGFLGPNGAGKTTTIRCLMGFLHPDKGFCKIHGSDCFNKAPSIHKSLGYLPGEIAFMDDLTGMQFIRFMAELNQLKDMSRANELIELFSLDTRGKIKKMSKGMKQKLGIICALMHQPEVLILDEPTSGLDPLMQHQFQQLLLDEKSKGTTILLSSHIFEEIDRTCDRAAILREGHLVTIEEMATLKQTKRKMFVITLNSPEAAKTFAQEPLPIHEIVGNQVSIAVQGELTPLIHALNRHPVVDMDVTGGSLEELFMQYYGGDEQ